ncbi:MAG: MFS transporter [Chloroflexi bacterium]|nr:MFS transporter [Chloroflexota bacterium]
MTTSAPASPITGTDNYKWKAFWTVALALFVMVMDFSITFLALSTIADDFNVTLRAVTWVAIASSLTVSAIMLPLGRVADMAGRKKFHITGMVFFVVGALLAAAAPSLGILIAARVVMAIGGAMGQSVVMAIITAVFPSNERGKGLGMLTTAVAIGATAGPIVAGPMLQFFGWRSLFIFLAVPTTLAIFFAIKVLDDDRIGSVKRAPNTRYDWPGAFLSAAALALMILTISNPLGFDWGSAQIIGGGILTVVLFAALIWWELRFSSPMLNLRFFNNSTFAFSTVTRLFGFIGASATAFLMPVFVQSFLGVSQSEAGMIMFVSALGMGIAGSSSGRLSDRFGFRIFTFIGIAVLFFTGIGLAFFDSSTAIWLIMLVLFINGLGMGLWMAPNMNATLSVIDRKDYGSVRAFLNLVRNVGSVSGQAITTAIVTGVMAARGLEIELSKLAANADGPAGEAFLDGWRIAFFVLLGFIVVSFVAALFTRPGKSPES